MNLDGPRAALRRLMVDTCTIWPGASDGTPGTLDPVSLRIVADVETALYVGPCKINDLAGARTDQAGQSRVDMGAVASIPLETDAGVPVPAIPVGARLVVTATGEGSDPVLEDRVYVVEDSPSATIALVRRLRLTRQSVAART